MGYSSKILRDASVRESEPSREKYRLIVVNNGVKAYNEKISINIKWKYQLTLKKKNLPRLDHFVASIVSIY